MSIVTKCPAPSPSRTIAFASVSHTCVNARVNVIIPASLGPNGGRLPAAALARITTMSFVDMSPSTVIALKDWSTAFRSAARRPGAVTAQSVVRNANIVASAGLIIPDPLAMPPTRIRRPSIRHSTAVSLIVRSVVRIASLAARDPWRLSAAAASGMPLKIRRMGRGRPITPVEATRTSPGFISSAQAVAVAMDAASARPCGPVQALAFPLLAIMAWAFLVRRTVRQRWMGAAASRFMVKTPAAVAGASETIRARSRLPRSLIPQLTPLARKPKGAVTPPSIGLTPPPVLPPEVASRGRSFGSETGGGVIAARPSRRSPA